MAKGDHVLLAVSGGVDSMVMLHLFAALRERMRFVLSIVHVNHQLRGEESLADEKFVQEKSALLQVPCVCERIDVMSYAHDHKLSKQAAARQLRYECFERVRQKVGARSVATAHQADDNAETVMLNILRGTGLRGLAGIPPKREPGSIIRPLLFATRAEIEAYAEEHGLVYRKDTSNRSLAYRRNALRHTILPVLQKRVPNIFGILNTIAETMYDVNVRLHRSVDEALRSILREDSPGQYSLDVQALEQKPDFLWSEILVEILHRLRIEPTEKKVVALLRLCTSPTGRQVEMSGTLSAHRNRDHVVFQRAKHAEHTRRCVKYGGCYNYNGGRISISKPEPVPSVFHETSGVEYVDADRLGRHLILRSWQAGDWFIPLGMKTKKKLSDFFTDQKIPRYQKSSVPVLESDGSIVWICGKRLDDRFKLTDRTRTAIRLTYQPSI